MMIREIQFLIGKEALIEWRNRHALNGILLYLASTIFICYLSLRSQGQYIGSNLWNALFWIIILFSAINAVLKSFITLSPGRLLYYYTLARPESIILSKIIYNSILLAAIGLIGASFYSLVLGNPVNNTGLFILTIFMGACSLASILTLISGIAAKASNSTTLMAVLSFPVILPVLLLIIRLTQNAIEGMEFSASGERILALAALNIIALTMSYILFPYLWKN